MKSKWTLLGSIVAVLLLMLAAGLTQAQGPTPSGGVGVQAALGTAFTYQGQLKKAGNPVNGTCDFQFGLWDSQSNPTGQVGTTQTRTGVTVTNGLFTVQLDFGAGAFQGDARWLQIGVKCAGDASYVTLSPRQPLTPAPYALALPGLWTQQNADSPNIIGGYSGNSVTSGVVGATIGGGGESGSTNRVTDNYGTVGGGMNNQAGNADADTTNTPYATVGGGYGNTASATYATVGGGAYNTASGSNATIGGGFNNTARSEGATIGGGNGNLITATAAYGTIGGGQSNTASGSNATIGGGSSNTANAWYATVGGGGYNTASGYAATVPGGVKNTAQGNYSFAAGYKAKANHQGAFVWADSTDADFASTANNQFAVRATGGVYFYTNSGLTSGSYLSAGGSSWNAVSNRALKENFNPVNTRVLLERLAAIPITTWNYKSQDPAIRHIGPMAEDFNALVDGLGGEGKDYINSLDADGVALAAIQGLYGLVQEKDARIAELEKRVAALEAHNAAQQAQIDDLEARLAALEQRVGGAPARTSTLPVYGLALGGLAIIGAVAYWRREGGGQ